MQYIGIVGVWALWTESIENPECPVCQNAKYLWWHPGGKVDGMPLNDETVTLLAVPEPGESGAMWSVWCTWCQAWHLTDPEPGFRRLGCWAPHSPYRTFGADVRLAGVGPDLPEPEEELACDD